MGEQPSGRLLEDMAPDTDVQEARVTLRGPNATQLEEGEDRAEQACRGRPRSGRISEGEDGSNGRIHAKRQRTGVVVEEESGEASNEDGPAQEPNRERSKEARTATYGLEVGCYSMFRQQNYLKNPKDKPFCNTHGDRCRNLADKLQHDILELIKEAMKRLEDMRVDGE